MKKYGVVLAAALAGLLAWSAPAQAGGMFQGYPAASLPLTGSETIPADTNLSGGAFPQTELITPAQLQNYVLGGTVVTGSATAGAATVNGMKVKVTSEALTTAAGSDYTLTLTNSSIAAASVVMVSVANGTNTTEGIDVQRVQPSANTLVVKVRNTHASSALNGTIVLSIIAF